MQQIRAFIAIELPEDARRALGNTARRLAEQLPQGSVRWVRPELIHLTLRFLGDTAVAKLPTIAAALDALGAQHAPFTLALSEAGCFPNRKRPRVIWAGLDGQLAPLQALKRDLDRALAASGWELEDRPFQPHLTLNIVPSVLQLNIYQDYIALYIRQVPSRCSYSVVHICLSCLYHYVPISACYHGQYLPILSSIIHPFLIPLNIKA